MRDQVGKLTVSPKSPDTDRKHHRIGSFGIAIVIGAVLGFGIAVAVLEHEVAGDVSTFRAFSQINLTFTRDQTEAILQQSKIQCERPGSTKCEFSDLWQHYTVVFDGPTGRVIELDYYSKGRAGFLERLRRTLSTRVSNST